MALRRAVLVSTVVTALLASTAPAHASSLEACAQRIIRDWYSGGRVDGVYPLPCYRAAIRALPEDVLQYSDADRDIARALAYARRGQPESSPAPGSAPPPASERRKPAPPVPTRAETRPDGDVGPSPAPRRLDGPVRLASDRDAEVAGAGLPYPVIVLASLAVILLVSAGAARLATRRR